MSLLLPDINIWLAYTVAGHPHHTLVRERWPTLEGEELAFCRITQMGYVRLLTTPAAMGPSVLTSRKAWQVYDQLVLEQAVRFVNEPGQLEQAFRNHSSANEFSYKRWTDAYIAAFATVGGMTALTLDQGFKRLTGVKAIVWEA